MLSQRSVVMPQGKEIGTLFAMLLESQSRPSYKPSPVVAQVLWIYLQVTMKFSRLGKATDQISVERTHHQKYHYLSIKQYLTSGVGAGNGDQAYLLSQQHSLHLADLAC